MRHRQEKGQPRPTTLISLFAVICVLTATVTLVGWRLQSNTARVVPTVTTDGASLRNSITISGAPTRLGRPFDGIGAISGGGGNSRLLIDYPPRQRSQILDYLFKPGYGAALQILKLEIGGDANATDGAEPSYQHVQGRVNCHAGYEFWLAQQALKRNPKIQIYALQWNAPGWAGGGQQDAWTTKDVSNVIGWMLCARKDHIPVAEVGGWNEHLPHGPTQAVFDWFVNLRAALDNNGFTNVKIVALDSFPHVSGPDVTKFLASHQAFSNAVNIIGYHDVCKHFARAHRCQIPAAARAAENAGKAIWVTELGALTPPEGYAAMARSINNAWIEAGVSGTVEWPMMSSMPADLPVENLGMIRASQPWSGNYQVGELAWVTAQTTEFTHAGWKYVKGASGNLAHGGSYVSYAGPQGRNWTMVAQTTDASAAQSVTIHLTGGLSTSTVHVWSTRLNARTRSGWLVHGRNIHPYHNIFGYRLLPGYVYTFTTVPGPHKGASAPRPRPMPLRYTATRDLAAMPRELAPMDGAFEYQGSSTTVFTQTASGTPDFWQPPKPGQPQRFPYAVVGGSTWRDYTVAVQVRFDQASHSAGLIARYDRRSFRWPVDEFQAYEFSVSASGSWRLLRNRTNGPPVVLASGHVAALGTTGWHRLSLAVHGPTVAGFIGARRVVRMSSPTYRAGIAGIRAGGFYRVDFRDLTVRP